MKTIKAKYVRGSENDRFNGMGDVLCPRCGAKLSEEDIERYSEQGSDRTLEICATCREAFEQESKQTVNHDELKPQAFSLFWNWIRKAIPESDASASTTAEGLNEENAQAVARILGGEAWQSGGGIWLVVLRRKGGRVVAISEDAVCEYADDEAWESGMSVQCISLS